MNKTFWRQLAVSTINEMRTGEVETVQQLWERVHSRHPEVKFESFQVEVNQLIKNGFLKVERPQLWDFSAYLKSWAFGIRYWLLTTATLGTLAVVEFFRAGFPLVVINWIAGTFLVLFAPGYALTWALFPSREKPSGLNRFALTVAMSLFLVPALGLIFNYTPVGIQAEPIALTIAALTLVMLLVGAYREFISIQTTSLT